MKGITHEENFEVILEKQRIANEFKLQNLQQKIDLWVQYITQISVLTVPLPNLILLALAMSVSMHWSIAVATCIFLETGLFVFSKKFNSSIDVFYAADQDDRKKLFPAVVANSILAVGAVIILGVMVYYFELVVNNGSWAYMVLPMLSFFNIAGFVTYSYQKMVKRQKHERAQYEDDLTIAQNMVKQLYERLFDRDHDSVDEHDHMMSTHDQKVSTLKREHDQKVSNLVQAHDQIVSKSDQAHVQEVTKLVQEHAQLLSISLDEHVHERDQLLSKVVHEHNEQVSTLVYDHEQQVSRLEQIVNSHEQTVNTLLDSHGQEMNTLVADHEQKMNALMDSHGQIVNNHGQEMDTLVAVHEQEMNALMNKHGQIVDSHEQAVNTLMDTHGQEREHLQRLVEQLREQLANTTMNAHVDTVRHSKKNNTDISQWFTELPSEQKPLELLKLVINGHSAEKSEPLMSGSVVANELGLSRSTVRRLMTKLADEQYINGRIPTSMEQALEWKQSAFEDVP